MTGFMLMQCARLYSKKDLRVETMPVPDIGDDEVLLRVKAAAVCGTDLRMYLNGASGVDEEHPLVLGHEVAGVVEAVGRRVSSCHKGQRVCIAPNIGCGVCGRCVSGKSHHCEKLTAMGIHMDGAFAEFMRVPADAVRLGNVVPLPDSVSFEAAAANEAFACVYNAFTRYRVEPGDTVLIIGAGAIGLMHAKLAKMAGAAKIILNDLSRERLEECARVEPSVLTVHEGLPEFIMDLTNGEGADVVITACSSKAAQKLALPLAALDGRVNFFGGLPKGGDLVELETNPIHYRQLSVTGTTRSSHGQYRETLRLIASGLVDIDPLITHRFPLSDIQQAFGSAGAAVGLKQVVVF